VEEIGTGRGLHFEISANVKCDRTWRAVKAILKFPIFNILQDNCNILRLEGVREVFEINVALVELG
jgi:hypothetical protein